VRPRIEARFDAMIAAGVVEEVRQLAARRPDAPDLPIANVHGLRALLSVIEGRLSLAQARESIVIETRQYAKRQRTWFRHQLAELTPIEEPGEALGTLERVLRLVKPALPSGGGA
jgi:tRNA dimethylallyltransferase